jgi:hypothetical protein
VGWGVGVGVGVRVRDRIRDRPSAHLAGVGEGVMQQPRIP